MDPQARAGEFPAGLPACRTNEELYVGVPSPDARPAEPGLNLDELARLVHQADPAAVLVAPRVLWRVIKHCRQVPGWGLQIPHRKSFVVTREELSGVVEPDELLPRCELPELVILLAWPEEEQLQTRPRDETLLEYWRLLFHARVHWVLQQRIARGELTLPKVRQRIHRIGQTEFDEVRYVLRSEELLLPPIEDRNVYVEFAAVFLELQWFQPQLLPRFFPTMVQWDQIQQVLAQDVDAEALFHQTRLAGAPDPQQWRQRLQQQERENEEEEAGPFLRTVIRVLDWLGYGPGPQRQEDLRRHRRLLRQAEKAAEQGNHVRAAILAQRAARFGTAKRAEAAARQAREHLDALTGRLQQAVGFSNEEAQRWRSVLWGLLDRAAAGLWSAEARLMYDLQKLCVDRERPLYRFRFWSWMRSRGRSPIRQAMPLVSLTRGYRHLDAARRRLPWVRLSEKLRQRLRELLSRARHALEDQLRPRLSQAVAQALKQGGLVPENLPEEVALEKISQELVDDVLHRGHVGFGSLRDAVARNQLKMRDLAGPAELWTGDPLLRSNAQLAQALPGVYRPAEAYLRGMQRISAALFGTVPGRLFTRWGLLPFGGAYLILFAVLYVLWHVMPAPTSSAGPEPGTSLPAAEQPPAERAAAQGAPQRVPPPAREKQHAEAEHHHAHGPEVPWQAVLGLGVFLLLMINVESFRQGVIQAMRMSLRVIRWLGQLAWCWLGIRWLKRLLSLREVRALWRYLFKPALFTALVWMLFYLGETRSLLSWHSNPLAVFTLFLVWNMVLNSRLGRDAEEQLSQWLIRSWRRLWGAVLVGLFYLVVDFFRALLEAVDRALYAVDQWLRFQKGETSWTTGLKLLGGWLWAVAEYVIRFAVTLLLEPQINPIKHFPVVTVSHKLLLPTAPILADVLQRFALFENEAEALAVAFGIIFCIPGIFGFLAWELKENWRLYEANRPRHLRPAVVGHHGETMLRLMKPGIHSGTLPKLYRKLRRAQRRAALTGRGSAQRKALQALEEVKHQIAHFVQRELVALLHRSRAWSHRLEVEEVHIGSNRIRVALRCGKLDAQPTWIVFEEQSGWLLASLSAQGWWRRLDAHHRQVFRDALAGLYKLAGAHLVRQQIEAAFPWPQVAYDLDRGRLVVWPSEDYACEAEYPLEEPGKKLVPYCRDPQLRLKLPVLAPEEVLFTRHPVRWGDWVRLWDRLDQHPLEPPAPLLPSVPLLPDEVHEEETCISSAE